MQQIGKMRYYILEVKIWLDLAANLQTVGLFLLPLFFFLGISVPHSFHVYLNVLLLALKLKLLVDMLDMLTLKLSGKKDENQVKNAINDYRKDMLILILLTVGWLLVLNPSVIHSPLVILIHLGSEMSFLIIETALNLCIILATINRTFKVLEIFKEASVAFKLMFQIKVSRVFSQTGCGGIQTFLMKISARKKDGFLRPFCFALIFTFFSSKTSDLTCTVPDANQR